MGLNPSVALILATLSTFASAAPRFEDYPAQSFAGRSAKVRLEDAKSRKYASMLHDAARHKPNFAGQYVLASWGCGASCTMSAAINAKTGAVTWLPFTVCCWEAGINEPLEFQRNSHLLIVHGSRNEQGNGVYYYQFDGQKFLQIEVPST